VKQDAHGNYHVPRPGLLEWAAKRRRPNARRRRGTGASTTSAGGGTIPATERPVVVAETMPPAVLEELARRIPTDDLLDRYRSAMADDAENRREAARLARERLELERRKLDADRSRFERTLQRDERAENLRQLKERFNKWMAVKYDWKPDDIARLEPLLDKVLAAIGNEALATAARGGIFVESAFLEAWGKTAKARNTDRVDIHNPQALEDLGAQWRSVVITRIRAATLAGVQAGTG